MILAFMQRWIELVVFHSNGYKINYDNMQVTCMKISIQRWGGFQAVTGLKVKGSVTQLRVMTQIYSFGLKMHYSPSPSGISRRKSKTHKQIADATRLQYQMAHK